MRTARWMASAAVAAIVVIAAVSVRGQMERKLGPYPVVVELFTSQG